MKKYLGIAAVALLLSSAAASAKVKIEPVGVQTTPDGVNHYRVALTNEGGQPETVSSIQLQSRDADSGNWRTIKVWDHPIRLAPYQHLTLSCQPRQDDTSTQLTNANHYDLRVTCGFESANR